MSSLIFITFGYHVIALRFNSMLTMYVLHLSYFIPYAITDLFKSIVLICMGDLYARWVGYILFLQEYKLYTYLHTSCYLEYYT